MGDERRDGAREDESWTEMESVQPDFVEAAPVRHGMVLGGRYAIEKIIGRGGCGVVVRAHDRDLQAVVAIKIVRAELAGQRMWADRLAREVKLARQIQHPHVCRVFDFEQADGRAFLVMELAEQGSLRDEIRAGRERARSWAERIADARAVASALAAIHAAGIVHRDLTPQNLLRMADGRLVVSDFGLATDVGESTSVHGGTVAYMAPEVTRGGKSTYASDVWALGVVMHEIVFGERPRWRDVTPSEMLPPGLGRKLTRQERVAFETCRACTAKEPAWRIARAADAGRLLTEGTGWWMPSLRVMKRPVMWVSALTLVAAVAAGIVRRAQNKPDLRATVTQQSPLIALTGNPTDWTDLATVVAEVPERIRCTRLLPDQRTIRFVWGIPPRAEDIDVVTRTRVSSPLVPASYAEGCPDLSPDGKRLVYQGHDPDGHAAAFLSERADGRDAISVVPTAEPSMLSEPTWLSDGDTFTYDVDAQHVGVFSIVARRAQVLPETTTKPFVTQFRSVSGSVVFVSTLYETQEIEFTGISVPSMREVARFRFPEFALDLRSSGSLFHFTSNLPGNRSTVDVLNLANLDARALGGVRDQFVRFPMVLPGGMAFVSTHMVSEVTVRDDRGAVHKWSVNNGQLYAARCGSHVVVAVPRDERMVVERVDVEGRLIERMTNGPWDADPVCSPDGRVLFYLRHRGQQPGVIRCDHSGCRIIADGAIMHLSISPDGRRLAFVALEKQGPVVEVIDANGGPVRKVSETETACKAGWSSPRTLWVSRRRGATPIWKEIDAESGRETGKSALGARDCSDGKPDPRSPVETDVRVSFLQISQLRLLGDQYLR